MSDGDWLVLLVGGHSSTGKTIVSERIGLSLRLPWMMVDDLRLAFQRADAQLPAGTDALTFDTTPGYWKRAPEEQREALIGVGEALMSAIEVIIENHVDQAAPIIIEGDGILPSLLSRPLVIERRAAVRAVFLVEPDESEILRNMLMRGRAVSDRSQEELSNQARGRWLFGQWLEHEAARHQLPVLGPRPWDTLAERIIEHSK